MFKSSYVSELLNGHTEKSLMYVFLFRSKPNEDMMEVWLWVMSGSLVFVVCRLGFGGFGSSGVCSLEAGFEWCWILWGLVWMVSGPLCFGVWKLSLQFLEWNEKDCRRRKSRRGGGEGGVELLNVCKAQESVRGRFLTAGEVRMERLE